MESSTHAHFLCRKKQAFIDNGAWEGWFGESVDEGSIRGTTRYGYGSCQDLTMAWMRAMRNTLKVKTVMLNRRLGALSRSPLSVVAKVGHLRYKGGGSDSDSGSSFLGEYSRQLV